MRDAQPGAIYLKDYRAPEYLITTTELAFNLAEEGSEVSSTLTLRRNTDTRAGEPLNLHGQDLELVEIAVDGRVLQADEYHLDNDGLVVHAPPAEPFSLRCVTRIHPENNTSLEGLYKSRTMFCTQCEAEGFRKITYYLDRPDVMSVFTVEIEADATRYPILLSNGNEIAREQREGGRHAVTWHDPHPKPAYLFALVAGDLAAVTDRYTTCNGREVDLHMYVEARDLDKCAHAMDSLKRSMRWDEEVFGREYDLDVFNIVAVDDFNMGAMENKSLNIFNTSCVLATPDVTTDAGFQTVEAIVAHEYFHNWSGNRVTCRDWFQLSLKEGFTVYRDAEFSSDMGSRTVKRVQDVNVLRSAQFAEDSGPMAHPVRPDSYIEISNFYTLTVYEKGAEVVRMIRNLLGPEHFRAGSDLYFERHDGQAVTCEDFVRAMEDASGVDLGRFRRWYSQAGTPRLTVSDHYDAEACEYQLQVAQHCPPTPGQPNKEPQVIPLTLGLLGEAGNLRLTLKDSAPDPDVADNTEMTLVVEEAEQTFVFSGVNERPVPSLLRGFSAPVNLDYAFSDSDLAALMSRDQDGFVRWDASQILAENTIRRAQGGAGEALAESRLATACGALLEDDALDPAMVALMLQLPAENYLADRSVPADVASVHAARNAVKQAIAEANVAALSARYEALTNRESYQADAAQIAARSLRNVCLDYLACSSDGALALAETQFSEADNLTDRLAALRVLAWYGDADTGHRVLADFYQRWKSETLVVNHWLQVQALDPTPGGVERVRALMEHPAFDLRNPNKVRALIGAFGNGNAINFHATDGSGHALLADVILELDALNPQIASRLLTPLTRWRKYGAGADSMKGQLERILGKGSLSPDVYEVVSKSLQDDN